jgi:hypothetical protein
MNDFGSVRIVLMSAALIGCSVFVYRSFAARHRDQRWFRFTQRATLGLLLVSLVYCSAVMYRAYAQGQAVKLVRRLDGVVAVRDVQVNRAWPIDLTGTQVTPDGLRKLKQARPKLEIKLE